MKSDPIDVAKAFIAAINRHSVSELGGLMSEDHTFIDSLGHTVVGREAMIAGWTTYFAMFPDYEISTENIFAEGCTVAIFGRASGTFNGKRGPVPESRIAIPAALKAIVADGKIKLWQVYTDWSEGVKTVERETSKNMN